MFAHGLHGLQAGREADDGNKTGQAQVLQDLHGAAGHVAKRLALGAEPAEYQARQQNAAAAAQGQRNRTDARHQQAHQQADDEAGAHVDEVRLGARHDHVAHFGRHALDVLLGAIDGHHVARLHHGFRLHGQDLAHAAQLHDKDAVTHAGRRRAADFAHRLVVVSLVGQHHVAALHHQFHAFDGKQFLAQLGRDAEHGFAPAHQQHDIVGRQHQVRADVDDLAIALHALDGDGRVRMGAFDVFHGASGAGAHIVDAADQVGRGRRLARSQHLHARLQRRFRLDRIFADGATHQFRQDIDADDDGAKRAEHIRHGIADGHVALQARHLVGRQAQLGDRIAGRADDGRLRQAARRHAGRQALVQAKDLGHDDHRQQRRHGQHHGQDDFAHRLAPQGIEELRPAFIADRVNEQGEQYRLDAGIDGHAYLADEYRHQQ